MKHHLILASGSPRRKELLSHLNIPFEIVVSHIAEESSLTDPKLFAEDIATQKGRAVCDILKKRSVFGESFFPFVVAADTLVTLKGKIYGKPTNREEARTILNELSAQTHEVITSVFMSYYEISKRQWREHIFSVSTRVTFSSLSQDILENYLVTDDSLDKAGAYGIQRQGLTFVHQLEGSYSNVVGFPLSDFVNQLRSFLTTSKDCEGRWRELFVTNA